MSNSRMRGGETVAHADDSKKPGATEIRAALERILASRCFQPAGRASHFLRFVVDRTLASGGQRLKGYTIAVEVFGRPADFDAQSDALVRVEAGRLRRRLIEYYASEGARDPVRIELPRGSYAVECRFAGDAAKPGPAAAAGGAIWRRHPLPWRCISAVFAGALLVAAIGVIAWQQAEPGEAAGVLEASGDRQRTEWPRIVVVPFESLGADRALDILAAGVTEEIMLRLNEFDLSVIASQGTWYRPNHAQGLDVPAADGYVLTGSVRSTATQVRIIVRLLDAETAEQLWAAAYDEPRAIEQLPVLQEQIARDVAAIAAPYGPIFRAELVRARRLTEAPKLRDCFVTYHDYRRRMVPEAYRDTVACFQIVSEQQPEVAYAWSGLAMVYVDEYAATFGRTGDNALEAARAATARALALDRDDFLAKLALTRVQFFDGDPMFRQSIDRSLASRPNSVQALAQGGFLLTATGDSAGGLLLAQKARQASKILPGLYNLTYAVAYLRARQYAAALEVARKIDAPNWIVAQAIVAAAAAHAGDDEVAHKAAERVLELYPEFEAEALGNFERWHFDPAFYEVLVSGLRAAGLDL